MNFKNSDGVSRDGDQLAKGKSELKISSKAHIQNEAALSTVLFHFLNNEDLDVTIGVSADIYTHQFGIFPITLRVTKVFQYICRTIAMPAGEIKGDKWYGCAADREPEIDDYYLAKKQGEGPAKSTLEAVTLGSYDGAEVRPILPHPHRFHEIVVQFIVILTKNETRGGSNTGRRHVRQGDGEQYQRD